MASYRTETYTSTITGADHTTLLWIDNRITLASLALACGYKNPWSQQVLWLKKWPLTLQPAHTYKVADTAGLAAQIRAAGHPNMRSVPTISVDDLRHVVMHHRFSGRRKDKRTRKHLVAIGQLWQATTRASAAAASQAPPVQPEQGTLAVQTAEDLVLQQNALLAECVQLLRKIHHQLMQPPTHHRHH